jgi:hypothetical protein
MAIKGIAANIPIKSVDFVEYYYTSTTDEENVTTHTVTVVFNKHVYGGRFSGSTETDAFNKAKELVKGCLVKSGCFTPDTRINNITFRKYGFPPEIPLVDNTVDYMDFESTEGNLNVTSISRTVSGINTTVTLSVDHDDFMFGPGDILNVIKNGVTIPITTDEQTITVNNGDTLQFYVQHGLSGNYQISGWIMLRNVANSNTVVGAFYPVVNTGVVPDNTFDTFYFNDVNYPSPYPTHVDVFIATEIETLTGINAPTTIGFQDTRRGGPPRVQLWYKLVHNNGNPVPDFPDPSSLSSYPANGSWTASPYYSGYTQYDLINMPPVNVPYNNSKLRLVLRGFATNFNDTRIRINNLTTSSIISDFGLYIKDQYGYPAQFFQIPDLESGTETTPTYTATKKTAIRFFIKPETSDIQGTGSIRIYKNESIYLEANANGSENYAFRYVQVTNPYLYDLVHLDVGDTFRIETAFTPNPAGSYATLYLYNLGQQWGMIEEVFIYDGCLLTSTVVNYLGLPDNGPELTAMRSLREHYKDIEGYSAIIKDYYKNSPKIIQAINALPDPSIEYNYVFTTVTSVMNYVNTEQWQQAHDEYMAMYNTLKSRYITE